MQEEYELRGRVVAQSFWSEMEKIANFRAVSQIAGPAREAARQLSHARAHIPWPTRHFSRHGRSTMRQLKRNRRVANREADQAIKGQRRLAVQNLTSADDGLRQAAENYLSSNGQVTRASQVPPPKTLTQRATPYALGAGVLGAGGLYLADRQKRQDPYTQYR